VSTGLAGEAGGLLETLVLGRVGAGARVGLVGEARGLAGTLRERGCEVYEATGPDWEAPPGFSPSFVVLGAEGVARLDATALAALRRAAPEAEVLFTLRNAGAASALLETLVGTAPARPGLSETALLARLRGSGYRVSHRQVRPCAPRTTALAEDAERRLRALLAQLSPSTQVEEGAYAVVPEAQAALVPGLLSVVLWCGEAPSPGLLDEALFSLACQEQHPLELILAAPEGQDLSAARALLERYARLGTFTARTVHAAPGGVLAEAVRQARGQYLSFLDARCVVYPGHFARLVRALEEGPAAWAVARAFRTEWVPTAGGLPYVRAKIPFPLGERLELEHLLKDPALFLALVVDRARVGPLPLATDDPAGGRLPDLPVRLGALFEPVFVAGIASCEVRQEAAPASVRVTSPPAAETWLLRTVAAWEERVARAREEGLSAREFRHRLVDDLNARIRAVPGVHATVRALAERLKQRREP
jgi:hypothetical protein